MAYHIVTGCFGFWLPNDPRGSGSEWVGSDALFRAGGRATKVDDRRSHAADRHDPLLRRRGKAALSRPPVRLDGPQALAVARGFAEVVQRDRLTLWALAVMPDHMHLVLARRGRLVSNDYDAEAATARFKAFASRRLRQEGLHPGSNAVQTAGRLPTIWQQKQWIVFLSTPSRVHQTIQYVERNPLAAGLPSQSWSFVTPCDLDSTPPASPSPTGGASHSRRAPPVGDGEAGQAGEQDAPLGRINR
ncbi:transposase [Alienimonas chondri]|uniref:transposase n=1 Tax=Alienimonas chondri TaxID=2681879 RepID=UPI001489EFE4|nr:transposase [Alienimonas chondri]